MMIPVYFYEAMKKSNAIFFGTIPL